MISKEKTIQILVIILISLSESSDSSGIGKCPRKYSMNDFDLTRFVGQWFEVERSFYMMEMIASCTSLNFTMGSNGNVDVVASTINRWTDKTSVKSGIAIPLGKVSSVLRFKPNSRLPLPVARLLPGAGIYYILDTNYDNYAIIWACTNYAIFYLDRFWILGRDRDFTAVERIEIYNKTKTFDLDHERLISSKNYFCD